MEFQTNDFELLWNNRTTSEDSEEQQYLFDTPLNIGQHLDHWESIDAFQHKNEPFCKSVQMSRYGSLDAIRIININDGQVDEEMLDVVENDPMLSSSSVNSSPYETDDQSLISPINNVDNTACNDYIESPPSDVCDDIDCFGIFFNESQEHNDNIRHIITTANDTLFEKDQYAQTYSNNILMFEEVDLLRKENVILRRETDAIRQRAMDAESELRKLQATITINTLDHKIEAKGKKHTLTNKSRSYYRNARRRLF